jgi:hypothetical protein
VREDIPGPGHYAGVRPTDCASNKKDCFSFGKQKREKDSDDVIEDVGPGRYQNIVKGTFESIQKLPSVNKVSTFGSSRRKIDHSQVCIFDDFLVGFGVFERKE